MRHSLQTEGFGVRLRPVRLEDARFIVWLRNLDHVVGRVGDSATKISDQKNWLKAYFDREGDYYFVIETAGGISVGTYGIYDVSEGSAEGGRWIVRPESAAAIAGAVLACDLAFGDLKLSELRGRTVASNQRVLSLNQKFGFQKVRVETAGQIIGGLPTDMVHYTLSPENWSKAREQIVPLARHAEQFVRDWEQAQQGKQPEWLAPLRG